MRSHEERVAETKRRIAKIEQKKRLRRNTVTMASAVAACLTHASRTKHFIKLALRSDLVADG